MDNYIVIIKKSYKDNLDEAVEAIRDVVQIDMDLRTIRQIHVSSDAKGVEALKELDCVESVETGGKVYAL